MTLLIATLGRPNTGAPTDTKTWKSVGQATVPPRTRGTEPQHHTAPHALSPLSQLNRLNRNNSLNLYQPEETTPHRTNPSNTNGQHAHGLETSRAPPDSAHSPDAGHTVPNKPRRMRSKSPTDLDRCTALASAHCRAKDARLSRASALGRSRRRTVGGANTPSQECQRGPSRGCRRLAVHPRARRLDAVSSPPTPTGTPGPLQAA